MKRLTHTAVATLVLFAAACGEKAAPPKPAETPAAAPAAPAPEAPEAVPSPPTPAILHPDAAKLAAAGPDSFTVHVVTSRGKFDMKIHRDWAPKGSDRLYYLVSNYYFDGIRFFRVLNGFMAQFGVSGDPAVSKVWRDLNISDDPVKQSNTRGRITFAMGGPNTRTTQMFINYGNNSQLDATGFPPVGEVTNGMSVVDSLYNQYGEGAEMGGRGPSQGRTGAEGNAYLNKEFPKLDYIVTARVSQEWKKAK
ncbi:MAG TPA: peptidylprolyl isomerase [Gemmatimonadaceae bacterium]|jgi:peptidyl-prolyl cis-trans isomerase A (cyclophilin A)|nr:peptidylprolyl isomerase [Gemmatimonadaceae bacterium]